MTVLAITIISTLSVAVVVLLGVLAKLLGDLKWSEANHHIVRLTVDAMHARDRDSLIALRWARSQLPAADDTDSALEWGRPIGLCTDEHYWGALSGPRESFTDVLRSIVARYKAQMTREAERDAHDATERELDARKRLVPVKPTPKKRRAQ